MTDWNRMITEAPNGDNPQVTIKPPPLRLISKWLLKGLGRRVRRRVETPPPPVQTPHPTTSLNTPQIVYMPQPQPIYLPAPY